MQDNLNDRPSCSNTILQHVHENSPTLPTVNNDSSINRRLTEKNLPDRRIERSLKKEIVGLNKRLQDSSKQCERLMKRLEKSKQRKKTLYNSNQRLSRDLTVYNSMFQELKIKRDQMKKSRDKKSFSQLMNCHGRRSAKNLVKKHYRKNHKTKPESAAFLRRKKLYSSVQNFFFSDENSSQAPGAGHFVVRKKVKKQKRYLADTIQNLHKKYCATVGNISRGLFYKLKPWWISKLKVSARETCLCATHENMKMKFQRIRLHKITEQKSLTEYVQSICCNTENEKCMNRTCNSCKDRKLPNTTQSQSETYYNCWKSEKVTRKGAKGRTYDVKIMSKHLIRCTVADLIIEFNNDVIKFSKHLFTTTSQFKSLNTLKAKIKKDEIYIVIDFSQNYNCKYGREIHAAHFGASKKQISVHSGGFYYKNEEDKIEFESFAVLSDDLTHDAVAYGLYFNLF